MEETLSESVLLYIIQLIAILSAILLALGYLKAKPGKPSGRVFALGASFVVLYIFEGMAQTHVDPLFRIDISPWPWRLLVHPAVQAVPGLFMIYCFLVFQEGRRLPPTLLALFAIQVLGEAIVLLPEGGIGWQFPDQVGLGLNVIQFVFVGLALYWTLKGWNDDLVQDRRVFRLVVISLQGFMVLFVLVVENVLVANDLIDSVQAQLLLVSAIASMFTAILLIFMKFDNVALSTVLREAVIFTEENEGNKSSELDLSSFDRLFRDPMLYRKTGLTISGLAKELNMPEYRTRDFIHNTLGHRNFKVMLHQYRIADACEFLSDPKNHNVPVQKIALTVGYQSATSFNNAFRETMGKTPSEYRRSVLTEVIN